MRETFVPSMERLAALVVAQDWAALQTSVSPWVAERLDVRDALVSHVVGMREEWDLPEDAWPSSASVDTNPLDVADVRGFYPEELDPAADEGTFIGYGCIQLLANDDEELDAYADVWVALFDCEGMPTIGLWQVLDPD
jgi:hypothetical protein